MLISHTHKWIFIHVPKNGGTTISDVLRPHCDAEGVGPAQYKNPELEVTGKKRDRYYFQHDTAMQTQSKLNAKGYDYNDYFSFSIVRNPWDRMVSIWYFFQKLAKAPNPDFTWPVEVIGKCKTFDGLVRSDYFKLPQLSYVENCETGDLNVDFVGRLENLREDFKIICEKIGLPRIELSHRNKTKHKHYTEYYDDETRQIVAEKYAKDIEYFGYDFGE